MTRDAEEIKVDIRATTIFRTQAGRWRVVHHFSRSKKWLASLP
jgi:ketosteroid isomerase-like protein